jgi:murein hydrolase activator
MTRALAVCIFFGLVLFSESLIAQTKEELERQRKETQEIINTTTRLLEQTSSTRQNSLERLSIVNRRLQLRRNLISTIESEINHIDRSVIQRQNRIVELESDLLEARNSYAKLINIAYRHRMAHHRLMFILAAGDFNQAYRRWKYLQQYNRSRQKQITQIEFLKEQVVTEIQELEKQKGEKVVLLQQRRTETDELSNESRQQNTIVEQLRRREDELKRQLAQQQREAQALQNAIEKLLRDETKTASEKRIFELTPEEKIISDQFQKNKGGLPWPIERGVVTGFFGEHPHPVLRGIKVQNNGIDISTVENAEVRALFNGKVRQVLTVPGSNNVILVRHGNFLTVYANLSQVYVRAGDDITTKQLIGRVFTDNDDNSSVLHLEIWEENKKLDPMIWLSRQ